MTFHNPHEAPEEEKDPIQPTVGYEGELREIPFVLVRMDRNKGKEAIQFAAEDEVLPIFRPTQNRVECVLDYGTVSDPLYFSEFKRIAKQRNYLKPVLTDVSHVFEFVTLPAKNRSELSAQFEEIKRIEIDLIHYLFQTHRNNKSAGFVCIKDWIDDYNERFSENPLPASPDSETMHIVLDCAISELTYLLTQQEKNDLLNADDLTPLAELIQSQLSHSQQFNFVVSLGKNMGSMLAAIYDENNDQHIDEQDAARYLKLIAASEELKESGNFSEEEHEKLKKIEEKFFRSKKLIQNAKEQKSILLQAEVNAEAACDYIRNQFNDGTEQRKLIKLEGFFFLLSMRVLTETADLVLPWATSTKNQYLFFLKTKLSDLKHSLSENDRLLLQKIGQTWNSQKKHQLLKLIAGSAEALTMRVGEDFSVKDVLESALGWTQALVCDQLANSPTKRFEPPLEPSGLHRKRSSLRRVLLEYRTPADGTVADAEQSMIRMLDRARKSCRTTYHFKQEWSETGKEEVLAYIQQKNTRSKAKSEYLKNLKLYNPALFQAVKSESQHEMLSIDRFQNELRQKKHELQMITGIVDVNVNKAIRLVTRDFHFQEDRLQQILFHEDDSEITLKQINYLYLMSKNPGVIPEKIRIKLEPILMQWFANCLISLFYPPATPIHDYYIQYMKERFALTKEIPAVMEFFKFIRVYSWTEEVQAVVVMRDGELALEYTLDEHIIQEISNQDTLNTLLHLACKNGLQYFTDTVLDYGASATAADLVAAFQSKILSFHLWSRLTEAGAKVEDCFTILEREGDQDSMMRMRFLIARYAIEEANIKQNKKRDLSPVAAQETRVKKQMKKEEKSETQSGKKSSRVRFHLGSSSQNERTESESRANQAPKKSRN